MHEDEHGFYRSRERQKMDILSSPSAEMKDMAAIMRLGFRRQCLGTECSAKEVEDMANAAVPTAMTFPVMTWASLKRERELKRSAN